MTRRPHLDVCICTYRRPWGLQRLLVALAAQQTRGRFTFSVVVADNDDTHEARHVVATFKQTAPFAVQYVREPHRNIALARNAALTGAHGDAVVFIDDDETPADDWLDQLVQAWQLHGVAGVLGPVRPQFDIAPPTWVIKGGFYMRPEPASGTVLTSRQCRTGNALVDRRLFPAGVPAFREEFSTGGEDQDFFARMIAAGHRFVWCSAAIVHEHIPPARWQRRFLLRRALLRGRDSLRPADRRASAIAKAVVAVPLYALALPWLGLGGQHLFMTYAVKLCDHAGRLLALAHLNPVNERPM